MSIIAPNRSENIIEKTRPTTRLAKWLEDITDQVNLINPDGTTATDHTTLINIGSNTHAQIDAALATSSFHESQTDIHFTDAPADGSDYARNNNAWVVVTSGLGADAELLHFWFD